MKKIFGKLAVLLLMAIMCLSACLFVSCGREEEMVETPFKEYSVNVENVLPLGEVTVNSKGAKEGGTLYEFAVTPKVGYAVKSFKISGTEFGLTDNKFECVLMQDVTVTVDYCRKNSEELTRRQDMVIDKISQYVDTYFKYDKDYKYVLYGADITLKAGVLHGGLPYTYYSSISPDVFLDFAVSHDNNGVYTLSFPMGYDPYYWGGSCGNAAYWAWATVSSTIRFSYSANMTEKNGVYTVGIFTYDPEKDINGDTWQDTAAICKANGMDVMFESYAMMNRADEMQYMNSELGNHVIVVTEVNVVRDENGKISPTRSYILYSDQHGGFHERPSKDGKTVYSSCEYNSKKTFVDLYEAAYLPMTCIELLDDSTPLATAEFTESLEASKLNKMNVLRGYVETNYAITKVTMVITDENGNQLFNGTRHSSETSPVRFAYSKFATTDGDLDQTNVYDKKLDLNELPVGKLHCVVTAYVSTGDSSVVRDFVFEN